MAMKINELFERAQSPAAEKKATAPKAYLQHEMNIAKKFADKGFNIHPKPAGDDTGFPDIGATMNINGKPLTLHIEVKDSKGAQMGSIRNWIFNGSKFDVTNYENPNAEMVIGMLNDTADAKQRAKKMLDELKKFFSKKVTNLQKGSLTAISDKTERYNAFMNYQKNRTTDTIIARLKGPEIGRMITSHYKKKYKPVGGHHNLLLMILGNEMFIIKTGAQPPEPVMKELYKTLGVDSIPELPATFAGNLEVRVQPRHLSKKGAVPLTLDTMANLRATGLTKEKGAILK